MLTKGAIGNLVNRYKAVLKKCNLINTFGSLAVASMLVMGGAGVAEAEVINATNYKGNGNVVVGAGSSITANLYGLYDYSSSSTFKEFPSSSLTINGGSIQAHVLGAKLSNTPGISKGNTVIIKDGEFSTYYGNTFNTFGTEIAADQNVEVIQNSISIKGGTFTNRQEIYGAWAESNKQNATASSNTVDISGITDNTVYGNLSASEIYGGYALTENIYATTYSVATAEKNIVTLGSITSDKGFDIYGGYAINNFYTASFITANGNVTALASNNEVRMSDGLAEDIYGGYAINVNLYKNSVTNVKAVSSNNTISISGGKVKSNIYD